MDELINISVNGNTLKKDSNCAGVQGDCNSTKLRITFSDNWDEYGKRITFWNALGQNPVNIQLGTNLLENILVNQNVYIVPIPGEAMTESGENVFVVQGTIEGAVKRTVEGRLKVLPSRQADDAGEPSDPTPTEAAQLRTEIDAIKDDIKFAAQGAIAAEEAGKSAKEAKESSERAESAAKSVADMTVTYESIDFTDKATVEKRNVDGVFNFHFGLPKAESGVRVQPNEPTEEDVYVWIDTSEETEDDLAGIDAALEKIIEIQEGIIGGASA